MVAALWSNSNWDDTEDSKGHRKTAIEGINDSFSEAILAVDDAMMQKDRPEEEKLDKGNPFFSAAERGLQKVEQRTSAKNQTIASEPTEQIDYMKGLDQE